MCRDASNEYPQHNVFLEKQEKYYVDTPSHVALRSDFVVHFAYINCLEVTLKEVIQYLSSSEYEIVECCSRFLG